MSLLMDALRKAEEQKQALSGQGGSIRNDEGLALEPITPPSHDAGGDSLPELPTRLEDLDEQFLAHASSPPPKLARTPSRPAREPAAPSTPEPGRATDTARANARLMFEAKQPSRDRRSFVIVTVVTTLFAAIGIIAYFWWQLQPLAGGTTGFAGRNASLSMPLAPLAASQAPAAPFPTVPPVPTLAEPASPSVTPDWQAAASAPTWRPAIAPPSLPPPLPPAATRPESPIRLTTSVLKTDPLLEHAWQAFNRGELDLAWASWQKVLSADPRSAGALHGLAALAQQRRQPDVAVDLYLRALEVDPKDALALSALVSLKPPVDIRQMGSRLKTLLAEQPESPYLNFALGNLYAIELRWAEAQQAFFRAHTADRANPDYLFNLAVSLDQLHKPQLAAQYYNQALAAAAQQPAGFDAAHVAARLDVLRAGLRP